MSLRYYANAPATTLTNSVSNVATVITVNSVTGLPLTYPYTLILDRGSSTEEVVEVTGASVNNLTVTRGADGTTAFVHPAGAEVVHGISARDLREPNTHINNTANVHGVTGDVVGNTDAQTLTNKTISAGSNDIVTSADEVVVTDANGIVAETSGVPVTAFVPVGAYVPFGGTTAPTGWLLCNGQAVSRTAYAELFAVIGTSHGAGNGTTTFNVPNVGDRAVVGASGSKSVGSTGGAASVALGTNELPYHAHSMDHDHPPTGSSGIQVPRLGPLRTVMGDGQPQEAVMGYPVVDVLGVTVDIPYYSGGTGAAGGGAPFSVQNPYMTANYIIRAA